MGILNSDGTQDFAATCQLNAPLDPERRMRLFEEPLRVFFDEHFPGSRVDEGRTLVDNHDQPLSADLELVIRMTPEMLSEQSVQLVDFINSLDAPAGSWLRLGDVEEGQELAVGELEGLMLLIPAQGVAQAELDALGEQIRAALTPGEHIFGVQKISGETRVHVYSRDLVSLADRLGAIVDAGSVGGLALAPIVTGDESDDIEWIAFDPELDVDDDSLGESVDADGDADS